MTASSATSSTGSTCSTWREARWPGSPATTSGPVRMTDRYLTISSWEEDRAGTYTYDLATGSFLRVTKAMSGLAGSETGVGSTLVWEKRLDGDTGRRTWSPRCAEPRPPRDRLSPVRWGAVVDTRWTVPFAAALAFLLRLPGLTRPVRPDEAGWFLVARTWDPAPDSVYGEHFVDRPPSLIGSGRPGRPPRRAGDAAPAWARWRPRRSSCWPPGSARWSRDQAAGRWSAVVVARADDQPADRPGGREGRAARPPAAWGWRCCGR